MKNKKGFTLIELLVVIAIIGVLALLGLRAYDDQRERACNTIAKANASTIQTMLVGYMGDTDITLASQIPSAIRAPVSQKQIESMINPYSNAYNVYRYQGPSTVFDADDDTWIGRVDILFVATNELLVNARGKDGELLLFPVNKSLPANKD